MHTCSCGAVFEYDEPHCQHWADVTIHDEPEWDPEGARDTHNVDGPLTPGIPCRRLNPSHSSHHSRPMQRAEQLVYAGQVAAAPASDAQLAGVLWTAVVLLSGLTTLVAACMHYLS